MRYAEAGLSAEGGSSKEPIFSNSVLGVIIFIMAEVMFFLGLISAFMISKANAVEWPPVGQPRLPVEATAFNTAILLLSGVTMYLTGRAFDREGFSSKSKMLFLVTLGLGTFFVVFQGFEWARILSDGLTMQSGNYGAFFYLIIGAHAIHAVGSLIAQGRLFWKFRKGTLRLQSFRAGQTFWYFVVGVWPVLYYLVYLD
ncbi:cytochrome c oxidase subunit 3 [Pelagicoccus mobilis]|uniref:Heme-copper oxidase subunit III n=1 Tax=Pelagicoccus mobilis TaxID=415221 RepID=A0A934VM75_9BACT|nr:heme-copper oxidase subunit III [Pelagicoccus mobilis]MBK1878556.1 heme-copper oxidase subunit III [Pelagicoccus mobilis]